MMTGQEELARTGHVNGTCRGGSKRPVPQLHKIDATLVAGLGLLKNLVRFEVEKTQPHGAVSHNAFEMSHAAAPAVFFTRIERHHRVAAFPDTIAIRIHAEADAMSERPDAHVPVELTAPGGQSRRDHIGGIV